MKGSLLTGSPRSSTPRGRRPDRTSGDDANLAQLHKSDQSAVTVSGTITAFRPVRAFPYRKALHPGGCYFALIRRLRIARKKSSNARSPSALPSVSSLRALSSSPSPLHRSEGGSPTLDSRYSNNADIFSVRATFLPCKTRLTRGWGTPARLATSEYVPTSALAASICLCIRSSSLAVRRSFGLQRAIHAIYLFE